MRQRVDRASGDTGRPRRCREPPQAKNVHGKAGAPIGDQRVTAVARELDAGLERVLVRAAS
jgi:hypothetical protein